MRRAVLVCIAFVVALLFAVPAYAVDGRYSIDELSTEIVVETDGSAHIVERQVLTFAERNTGVVWYLHVPEDGESVRISSVKAAPADDGGTLLADWTRLQMIDSNPRQQGRNPGDSAAATLRIARVQPWYSYNIGDGMVRCYFPTGSDAQRESLSSESSSSDNSGSNENNDNNESNEGGENGENNANGENDSGDNNADGEGGENDESGETQAQGEEYHTYVIEIDYTIAHRVRVYRDVAELYWRYVNDSLPSGSNDVNLQIRLPIPYEMEPGAVQEYVRAWGHGPNEGTFSINDDGSVTYHINSIAQGHYAEAHVIFPAEWMTNLSPDAANRFSSVRGPSAIAEEDEWVDKSQREAAWDNNVRVLFLVLAVVIILVGLAGVLSHVFRGHSANARRALMRVAVTFGIVALGEHLFFREPLTTLMLFVLAAVVAAVGLMLPLRDDPEEEAEDDEDWQENAAQEDAAQEGAWQESAGQADDVAGSIADEAPDEAPGHSSGEAPGAALSEEQPENAALERADAQ